MPLHHLPASAVTASSRAARRAGHTLNKMPVPSDVPIAATTAHQGALTGNKGYILPISHTPASPNSKPTTLPMPDNKMASAKNKFLICTAGAPSALSRPIYLNRCDTAISITFMIRIPATDRLIAAMPPTASVSARRMRSKVASTASWVMTVTSCSP